MRQEQQRKMTKILFIIYVIILTWVILFKMQTDFSVMFQMRFRSINLIPFQGSVIVNGKVELSEIILNIVAFLPVGIYVAMLKEDWNIIQKAAPAFFISLAFEAAQYMFGIGASDITDLLGNTLGGVIGIFVYFLLSKMFKKNAMKIVNILACIGTVLLTGLLALLIIANL